MPAPCLAKCAPDGRRASLPIGGDLTLRARWRRLAVAPLTLAIAVAGCGGGGSKSTTSKPQQTKPAQQPTGGGPAVTTGPVRARLVAPNHSPIANKSWAYSVSAHDPAGHPLSGKVATEFLFSGQVVGRETPPTHPLKDGRMHDEISWPPRAIGEPLTFRTVVETPAGAVNLDWPVSVRR